MRGSDATVLANLRNANVREQLDARHMNRALWPATWEYFFTNMIGVVFNDAHVAWARNHFVEHVRASGPLPTLRVGRQPYGVLPVTSLNLWKSSAPIEADRNREAALKNFLLRMWGLWYGQLARVPRVGRIADNPDKDFADIFSMDGVSSSYVIRHLMGQGYQEQLWRFLMPPGGQSTHNLSFWFRKRSELTKRGLAAAGLNFDPRVAYSVYSGWSRVLRGPVAQPTIGSEDAPLDPNYIDLLLNTSDLEALRRETFTVQPRGLVYSLLRHAMLLAYWTAATRLQTAASGVPGPPPFDREFFDDPNTAWAALNGPAAGVTDRPLWAYLRELQSAPADAVIAACVSPLLELRESLAHLKNLSAAKLQRLCAGTIDLASHRLDAWVTSFATKRLAELRAQRGTGIVLGGYGWVVNLKPSPPPAAETVPGVEGVIYRPNDNPGYTHTPSLAQAATTAVLRSGHLTHATAADANLLAIDLSSGRVRLATWLLEGVRQGQPLGALLGYRFERHLHDSKLAHFISYFRQVAPLVANKMASTNVANEQSIESVAANNVVDGLVLQRKWRAAGSLEALFNDAPKKPDPAALMESGHALDHALMALEDTADAVSDALLAETVHQAVQGNPTRTTSTLDAIAAGAAPPPELDVVRTPRTGIALTHRMVMLLDGTLTLSPGWAASGPLHRANAEPRLNAWAASLLPNPAKVRCVIERVDGAGAVGEARELRLTELHLSPLDVLYAPATGPSAPGETEQRLLHAAAPLFAGRPPDSILRVRPERGANWSADDMSYGEFAEMVRAAHALITGTRGIDGSEMNLPEANQPAGVDVAELKGRADNAAQELRRTSDELAAWLAAAADASLDTVRSLLDRCSRFGISGAVPVSSAGVSNVDREALSAQARAVARQVTSRIERLNTLDASAQSGLPTDEDERRHHVARLQAVFGESFVVLPLFKPGNVAEIEMSLAKSSDVQDGDPLAVVTWYLRASRVREGVERLETSIRYADAMRTGEQLHLRVAQLPFQELDRWVGLPFKAEQPLSQSRFSLVIQSAPTLDVHRPLAGLLIDEWVEVVPSARETTGMVFEFDQPDAAPPQSVLLAVPPDLGTSWTLWTLQQVLLETLDLARLRLVDPEALDVVGHFLPAAYFAVNATRETVTTDFASLM